MNMKRYISTWIAAAALMLGASDASAQLGWWNPGCDSGCDSGCESGCASKHHQIGANCRFHYDENVIWPYQFVPSSKNSVIQFNAVQANAGWRRQNILGAYHFDPADNSLTQAGSLKLKWILTQAPEHRRTVLVERGRNLDQTNDRLASVRDIAGGIQVDGGPMQLRDTHLLVDGHPATYVDATFVGLQNNRPPPVLPSAGGTAGSAVPTE
ncbi:MAG: hypothetical protein AAGA92_12780 [Planctomycetota bacterium]